MANDPKERLRKALDRGREVFGSQPEEPAAPQPEPTKGYQAWLNHIAQSLANNYGMPLAAVRTLVEELGAEQAELALKEARRIADEGLSNLHLASRVVADFLATNGLRGFDDVVVAPPHPGSSALQADAARLAASYAFSVEDMFKLLLVTNGDVTRAEQACKYAQATNLPLSHVIKVLLAVTPTNAPPPHKPGGW